MSPREVDPFPLDDHLCFSIYGAHLALQRIYKPVLDRLGLTYPQYLALSLLWETDGQTVGQLAAQLDLVSSTMTPLLKRLEASGFVRRARDPENERQVVIFLTTHGAQAQSHSNELKATLLAASGWSDREVAVLNATLQNLRDELRESLDTE
ncbi:MAG: MarR family transcriptional regulator [Pseudomonadota bacterium]